MMQMIQQLMIRSNMLQVLSTMEMIQKIDGNDIKQNKN